MKDLASIALLVVLLAGATLKSYAQYCGQGTNQINLYVRNGLNATNPQFVLYSASPIRYKSEQRMIDKVDKVAEYLSTTFFPTDEVYFSRWWTKPKLVRADLAEKFIKSYDPKDFEHTVQDRNGDRKKLFLSAGKIEGDSVSFGTYEMDDVPYLLKVWADNYEPVYVLEAHHGGCSRKYDLLLTNYRWPPPKN